MKKIPFSLFLLFFLLLLVLPLQLSAKPLFGYLGVNFGQYTQEPEKMLGGLNAGKEFDTQEVHLRLGGRISDYFASELRLGGLRDEWQQGVYKYRYDYSLGAHLRAHYPLGFLVPYVQLGYTLGKRSVTYPVPSVGLDYQGSETLLSYSYGIGVDLLLGDRLGVNLEYADPYPLEDTAPTLVTGGLFWRF